MRLHTFRAMGTEVSVVLDDHQSIDRVRRFFAAQERRFSRFDERSDLSRLNADPSEEVVLDPEMARILGLADELRSRTGGLVDPAVGAAVRGWGYDADFDEIAGTRRRASSTSSPVPRWWIDGDLLVRPTPTILDLGGIAKGHTCDLAVEEGLALVASAGGDVRSAHPEAQVELVDPWDAATLTVTIGCGALATSSRTRRRWTTDQGDAHHLIDPRTGRPADTPVLSATAWTATAVEAEAAAKAILIRGADGLAWAERQSWIRSALVVWHDGSVYATVGWEVAA